jgi:transposase-like protein
VKYPADEYEQLIRDSLARGYSARQVADAVGCSDTYVRRVRDGIPRGKPGPKPAPIFQRKPQPVSSVSRQIEARNNREDAERMARAVRHWLKNDDLELQEVAEMYDVSKSALIEARKRHREAA